MKVVPICLFHKQNQPCPNLEPDSKPDKNISSEVKKYSHDKIMKLILNQTKAFCLRFRSTVFHFGFRPLFRDVKKERLRPFLQSWHSRRLLRLRVILVLSCSRFCSQSSMASVWQPLMASITHLYSASQWVEFHLVINGFVNKILYGCAFVIWYYFSRFLLFWNGSFTLLVLAGLQEDFSSSSFLLFWSRTFSHFNVYYFQHLVIFAQEVFLYSHDSFLVFN